MPVTHEFKYFKPGTLEKALEFLASYQDKSRILAGGTDLAVNLKEGLETPDYVIDIKAIDKLKEIKFKNNALSIGALVTFDDLIRSPVVNKTFPLIVETAQCVGSMAIRNRATLVGNICSAVPSLDSGPFMLLYEADIIACSSESERKISILDWFLDNKKTSLKSNELVKEVIIPLPKVNHAGCYKRMGRYKGEDLAQAGVGIMVFEDHEYRVAFNAVGPVPSRSGKIESLLSGNEITDDLIAEVQELIPGEISPITDIRASREYRIQMVRVMFERGMRTAVSRMDDGLDGKAGE